jgi:DNA-binding SARP family transcriptional activator/pimeloyl-ACP methyl ester carboxylesterase
LACSAMSPLLVLVQLDSGGRPARAAWTAGFAAKRSLDVRARWSSNAGMSWTASETPAFDAERSSGAGLPRGDRAAVRGARTLMERPHCGCVPWYGRRGSTVEFGILGPLEVRDENRVLEVRGRKRALLALLLVNANRTLSIERIVDELWGEFAPGSASKMVQVYVSQLRKLLADGILRTRPPGYVLELEPEQLDLHHFERLVGVGRAALAEGDAQLAAARLAQALSLWRGPALAEFASEPFAKPEGTRLEERRLAALEERIDADLACGRQGDLVGELESLVARYPLREGLCRRRMLALYRSGRQAEALAVYHETRRVLTEELGLEPSPALRELQRRILAQDPVLELGDGPAVASAPAGESHPETRYARSGDVAIAYQIAGEGSFDLVVVPGYVSHVELGWTTHPFATVLRRLAAVSRLIVFDKRGTGMSDRVAGVASLETRMDDVRAVMDGARSARAAILGISEGAPMSLLFAATYPERVAALVLLGGYARTLWAPDYPWGFTDEHDRAFREGLERLFGARQDGVEAMRWFGRYNDEQLAAFVDFNRRAASPGAWRALNAMNREIDVRHALPAIRVPTLVVHGGDDPPLPVEGARYIAERIPGARLLELPGELHFPAGAALDRAMDEIERFLAGVWEAGGWDETEPERVLATVLFCDIVDSSARAAELGDRAWRELLEHHHVHLRRELRRFRGTVRRSVGDGVLASFDGPARAIRCGCAIVETMRELGLAVRVGLHTGECELSDAKIAGIAVDTGARVAEWAGPGEVLVTGTLKDLVAGSGIRFADRGVHELKGIPGEWRLLSVELGFTQ